MSVVRGGRNRHWDHWTWIFWSNAGRRVRIMDIWYRLFKVVPRSYNVHSHRIVFEDRQDATERRED